MARPSFPAGSKRRYPPRRRGNSASKARPRTSWSARPCGWRSCGGGWRNCAPGGRAADADAVRETLQSLGCRRAPAAAEIEDWLATVDRAPGPLLIRAGSAARDWMNRPGIDPRGNDGIFLAACLWCRQGAATADRPALLVGAGTAPRPARLACRSAVDGGFSRLRRGRSQSRPG